MCYKELYVLLVACCLKGPVAGCWSGVRVGSLCCWLQVVPKDQLQVTGVVWEWVPCVAGCRLFQRTSCRLLEWCESGYLVLLVAGCSKGPVAGYWSGVRVGTLCCWLQVVPKDQLQVTGVVWEWVPCVAGCRLFQRTSVAGCKSGVRVGSLNWRTGVDQDLTPPPKLFWLTPSFPKLHNR